MTGQFVRLASQAPIGQSQRAGTPSPETWLEPYYDPMDLGYFLAWTAHSMTWRSCTNLRVANSHRQCGEKGGAGELHARPAPAVDVFCNPPPDRT